MQLLLHRPRTRTGRQDAGGGQHVQQKTTNGPLREVVDNVVVGAQGHNDNVVPTLDCLGVSESVSQLLSEVITTVEVLVRSGTRETREKRKEMEIPKLLWHIKQRQDPKSNSMPVQIGEARSPTLGHFLGMRDGASGRRCPQCRDCRDPPLALARDSATERRIRCPGAGASSGRRCAAGGWRALCTAGTITCKFDGGSRHSTLSVPHHSPSVAHGRRSLTRVTLFFLVSKARPFIPLLAPNCSRLALWSSISTGSQGSLKKQGTAWLGRAWRVALSLALSTLSVQRLQLALHLTSLSSLTSLSRSL